MLGMLVTGTINTVVMKAQNKIETGGNDKNGKPNVFTHPYF
jgi:hypothetical protein